MAIAGEHRLSLAEGLVLCLIGEGPTYGLALAGLLARDGGLGRIWSVPKAMVYYALQQLEFRGLIRTARSADSHYAVPSGPRSARRLKCLESRR